jgi:hypothetical protein
MSQKVALHAKQLLFSLGILSLMSCPASKETNKEPSKQGAAYSCQEHQDSAKRRLAEVMSEHLACTTNADCSLVELQTSCSDSCTAVVNQKGAQVLPIAISAINTAACAGFEEAQCSRIHPPCAPPGPPRCVEMKCQ